MPVPAELDSVAQAVMTALRTAGVPVNMVPEGTFTARLDIINNVVAQLGVNNPRFAEVLNSSYCRDHPVP